MNDSLNLVLLGGPGAGKGTQAEKLKKSRGLNHISTGDILRSEVASETDLGMKAKEYMDKGDLVPDDLVIDMVERHISGLEGILFDGFPRTVAQAEALEDIIDLDLVLYIDVSEEEVVKRLSARRVCSNCGANYNVKFKPPEEEGVCDNCGGELVQREDDQPEVIQERYDTFISKTQPLVDYYKQKDLLARIDGEASPQKVHENIEGVLGDL